MLFPERPDRSGAGAERRFHTLVLGNGNGTAVYNLAFCIRRFPVRRFNLFAGAPSGDAGLPDRHVHVTYFLQETISGFPHTYHPATSGAPT
ncbi:hypothetical protein OA90_04335 [Labrenzia sp. OB1]|nr:hypothetical protein OA90_04335 [Labrenzia sp. OB1]